MPKSLKSDNDFWTYSLQQPNPTLLLPTPLSHLWKSIKPKCHPMPNYIRNIEPKITSIAQRSQFLVNNMVSCFMKQCRVLISIRIQFFQRIPALITITGRKVCLFTMQPKVMSQTLCQHALRSLQPYRVWRSNPKLYKVCRVLSKAKLHWKNYNGWKSAILNVICTVWKLIISRVVCKEYLL